MNRHPAHLPVPARPRYGVSLAEVLSSQAAIESHAIPTPAGMTAERATTERATAEREATVERATTAKVSLLFTRYSDPVSRFVSLIGKHGFSHVSISIESDPAVFYSFNCKGFAVEKPLKHMPKRRLPGNLLVSFEVPEHVHQALKDEIDRFLQHRETYRYAHLGVLCCLARIPVTLKGKRFCSQFVAEVLERAGMVRLHRYAALCLPEHLINGALYAFPATRVVRNWP